MSELGLPISNKAVLLSLIFFRLRTGYEQDMSSFEYLLKIKQEINKSTFAHIANF